MRIIRLVAGVAVATALVGAAPVASVGSRAPATRGTSATRGAEFDHPLQNPYFPLQPGTVYRYRVRDEGERLRERVTITRRTRTILGVPTTVVRDVLRRHDGTLAEKTHDWYAADNAGNVWYFGENTATYDERGHLESREGSWQAGVKGAVAGMIMPAGPRPTDAYRQEYRPGKAEDQAWIVQRHATVRVPYGRLHDVVRSFEWSRLEPRVMSAKYYAPGIGIVREQDIAGGAETVVLVSVRRR